MAAVVLKEQEERWYERNAQVCARGQEGWEYWCVGVCTHEYVCERENVCMHMCMYSPFLTGIWYLENHILKIKINFFPARFSWILKFNDILN